MRGNSIESWGAGHKNFRGGKQGLWVFVYYLLISSFEKKG